MGTALSSPAWSLIGEVEVLEFTVGPRGGERVDPAGDDILVFEVAPAVVIPALIADA